MGLDLKHVGKLFKSNKSFEVMPGDIVNVPVGRGWRKAKVISKGQGSTIKVKFKTGETTMIKVDEIMTDDETKNFRKSGNNTRSVRNGTGEPMYEDQGNNLTDMTGETSESPRKKTFGVL